MVLLPLRVLFGASLRLKTQLPDIQRSRIQISIIAFDCSSLYRPLGLQRESLYHKNNYKFTSYRHGGDISFLNTSINEKLIFVSKVVQQTNLNTRSIVFTTRPYSGLLLAEDIAENEAVVIEHKPFDVRRSFKRR